MVFFVAAEESAKSTCEHTSDCVGQLSCIDGRCLCDPLFGHTGLNCDGLRWNSWAVVVALALVCVFNVAVLRSEGAKLSSTSKRRSGLMKLTMLLVLPEFQDTGLTTIRMVVLCVVFDIFSSIWKMLAATNLVSDSMFAYWDSRIVLPISEGIMFLPVAMVVSVWVDVANSTMSRLKSKKRLERTKKILHLGTGLYVCALLLLRISDNWELAATLQMVAVGVGITACGSGAAKLCGTLRAMGVTSASIAEKVFKVSQSMGICLYAMLCGEILLLSSHTRKSDTANLAFTGMSMYSLAKCFLNRAILRYMIQSAFAKQARLRSNNSANKSPAPSPSSSKKKHTEQVGPTPGQQESKGPDLVAGPSTSKVLPFSLGLPSLKVAAQG